MMGDNRDNSEDSRFWGFAPATYVKGQALFIYFSTGDVVRRRPVGAALQQGAVDAEAAEGDGGHGAEASTARRFVVLPAQRLIDGLQQS